MSLSPPTSAPTAELRYWCFLSYSSRDTALSKRLYHALETYRIPRDLVGRPGRDGPVPKKLFPCFRDRDELPLSSDLGATIQDALRASRYLIVICTPASAQSRWVNEEVLYFKSLGRADRILALIASGEPNASDHPGREKEECFCPALRYVVDLHGQLTSERSEPIAGDFRKGGDGWTNAFLKAIAGITGLGFNAFAQRERKRRRRQQILAGAFALLALAAALWYWDYTRVKVAYFQNLTSRWSVPEGVIKLSADQAVHRLTSYRFESSRYKVRRVTEINGSNYPVDDPMDPTWHNASSKEINYRDNGDVNYIAYRDHDGREVFREVYSDLEEGNSGAKHHYVDFKLPAQDAAANMGANFSLLGALGQATSKSEITGEEIDYDSAGRADRIQFRNSSGSLRANEEGIFGQHFEHTPLGLISKKDNLGPDGQPQPDQRGVVARASEYDSAGNEIQVSYFGVDGKPILNRSGQASFTRKFDANGNVIEETMFGVDGNPVLDTDGVAKITRNHDQHGNETEEAYFGIDGQPVLSEGIAKLTQRYDERGNAIEEAFFGLAGQPVAAEAGVARITWKFDERDNEIEEAYFGVGGQPVLDSYGVSRLTWKYDQRGNQIEMAFFGVNDQPVLGGDGFAKMMSKYDERNNRIEEAYFGVDGQLTLGGDGIAKLKFKYDERGNPIEFAYFGIDDHPIIDKDGGAKVTCKYDERGNEIEEDNLGLEGHLVIGKTEGYAYATHQYDAHGSKTEDHFFDVDSKPLEVKGACRIVYTYDATGKLNKTERYNAKGSLVAAP